MNRLLTCSVAIIFLAAPSLISAQEIKIENDSRPFNSVEERIAKAIKEALPDWERTSVPPLNRDGLDNFRYDVIIDQWSSSKGNVKIVIMFNSSEDDAKSEFKKFTVGVKANEHLPDVDDEALAWGISKSIALRKGIYSVYISSIAIDVPEDNILSDKKNREEAKLNRMFAKIVTKALKNN